MSKNNYTIPEIRFFSFDIKEPIVISFTGTTPGYQTGLDELGEDPKEGSIIDLGW